MMPTPTQQNADGTPVIASSVSAEPTNINDPMARIIIPSKTLLIQQIRDRKSSIYDEEIPRIESYGTEDAFFEYFILQAAYKNDIALCGGAVSSKVELCKSLFTNVQNKTAFLESLQATGESPEYAEDFYEVTSALSAKRELSSSMKNLALYLAYRKILSPTTNTEDLYFAYLRFELLLPSIDKDKHFDPLLKELGVDTDESLKTFIKNTLI